MNGQTGNTKRIGILIFFALLFYAILPQLTGFQDSLRAIKSADPIDLIFSFIAVAASYIFAAFTYYLLASKPLSYFRTLIVEIAATFINRLLPAGIGGMGVNYAYLRHNKHSQGAAGSVVATNNLLGFVGHILLFSFIYLVFQPKLPTNLHFQSIKLGIFTLVALLIAGWVIANTRLGNRFQKQIAQTRKQFSYYRNNPSLLPLALLSSVGLTFCVAIAFYFCVIAFRLDFNFTTDFLIFTVGFAIGNATPTPGGLGGIEAGLVLGLIAYGAPKIEAIAVVLVFRLISFWLPTAFGAIAFLYASQRKML